jgi:uncharacterized protein (TIGR02145 family)
LLIPFISIRVNIKNYDPQKNIITALNNDIAIFIENQNSNSSIKYHPSTEIAPSIEKFSSGISYMKILSILYTAGVILLLARFLRNIFFISQQKRVSEKITYSGHKFVLIDNQINPFCFFNTIFVSKQEYLNNNIAKDLLTHELEHINQSHSIDVIFIELIQIIYWFNPVLILYNRAIRINHEYLADNGVIQTSPDINSYANNLINFISCKRNIPMTSGFNPSLTRKRLIMLTKSGSSKINDGLKIFLASFFGVAFFLILSCFPAKSQSITPDRINAVQAQVIRDIDGNDYKTVKIGTMTWMSENLKTTKFNDGTVIPMITDDKIWQEFTPAYCWYNNDEMQNKDKYGALYNWYAVNTNKLCPVGWHVPSNEEIFGSFFKFLSPKGLNFLHSGEDLFKTLSTHEFKPMPAGLRNFVDGKFYNAEKNAYWWSSSAVNSHIAYGWGIEFEKKAVNPYQNPSKRTGYSVRCVKDYTIEELNSLKSQKDSILNTLIASDFTGKWQLKEVQLYKGQASPKITIKQTGNDISIKGAFDFIDKKPIKGRMNYTLDGNSAIINISRRKGEGSANWGDNKQYFAITTIKFSIAGPSEDSKCVETYTLGSDGKSLTIYYNDSKNPQWYQYSKE